jgi:hypothetical protein
MSEAFDPYHKWLGIPPKDQPPNHYRLLGIELFETDPDVIDAAASKQVAYLQGCATGPHIALSQTILNEVAAARLCLLNPGKKSAYDSLLRHELDSAHRPPEPQPASNRRKRPRPLGIIVAGAGGLFLAMIVSLWIRENTEHVSQEEPRSTRPAEARAARTPPATLTDSATNPEPTRSSTDSTAKTSTDHPQSTAAGTATPGASKPAPIEPKAEPMAPALPSEPATKPSASPPQPETPARTPSDQPHGKTSEADTAAQPFATRVESLTKMNDATKTPSEFGGIADVPLRATLAPHVELRMKKVAIWTLKQGGKIEVELQDSHATQSVQQVSGLPKSQFVVTQVDLKGVKHLRDGDMRNLVDAQSLMSLSLMDTAITNSGLVHLTNLVNLRKLNLAGTKITDAGLADVGKLVSLETLYLGGTHVSDKGMPYLNGLTNLKFLGLYYTHVTDRGIARLWALKNLEEVNVGGTKISNAAILRVWPKCRIKRPK